MTRLRLPRPPTALVVIVAAGFVLRLAWCIYAARDPQGLHDPLLYRFLSDAVASGHGYDYPPPFNGPGIGYAPTAYYPPGYPLLLAAFAWLTLHTFIPEGMTVIVVLVNLAAGVAAIVLVYAIGHRLADMRTGLIAAAIVALWPNLILHTAVTLSETALHRIDVAHDLARGTDAVRRLPMGEGRVPPAPRSAWRRSCDPSRFR